MNFKTGFILALLSLMTLGQSCSDDEKEFDLDLNFTLEYDNSPLVGFENLAYPLGFNVFFTKYSMFLSDITLHGVEGDHELSPVEFIDLLTDVNDLQRATDGQTLSYKNVPAGNYTSLSFNIGVPAEVNATAPADYDPSSPLSNTGEYWEGWSSYIFHKIEGKMDEDGNGEPEAGIALHIGSDQAFRQIEKDIIIQINDPEVTVNINFDLAQILNLSGGYYDFMETPQIHHLGVLPKALPILDNTVDQVVVVQK